MIQESMIQESNLSNKLNFRWGYLLSTLSLSHSLSPPLQLIPTILDRLWPICGLGKPSKGLKTRCLGVFRSMQN
jgi:hypothetical protein